MELVYNNLHLRLDDAKIVSRFRHYSVSRADRYRYVRVIIGMYLSGERTSSWWTDGRTDECMDFCQRDVPPQIKHRDENTRYALICICTYIRMHYARKVTESTYTSTRINSTQIRSIFLRDAPSDNAECEFAWSSPLASMANVRGILLLLWRITIVLPLRYRAREIVFRKIIRLNIVNISDPKAVR